MKRRLMQLRKAKKASQQQSDNIVDKKELFEPEKSISISLYPDPDNIHSFPIPKLPRANRYVSFRFDNNPKQSNNTTDTLNDLPTQGSSPSPTSSSVAHSTSKQSLLAKLGTSAVQIQMPAPVPPAPPAIPTAAAPPSTLQDKAPHTINTKRQPTQKTSDDNTEAMSINSKYSKNKSHNHKIKGGPKDKAIDKLNKKKKEK